MGGVERDGADPVQGSEVPCQRASDGPKMDRARRSRVAEVRERQVEEVNDKQQLSEPKVTVHPSVDEAGEEKI